MTRTKAKTKKATKSPLSPNTKRSSASTLTSKAGAKAGSLRKVGARTTATTVATAKSGSGARKIRAEKLATELYSRSLQARPSVSLQEAVVEGVSMWPTLRPGFRIRYRSVSPESLNPGELLVLRSSGRRGESHWRVHRLIGRVGPYFVEAGDNAFSAALVRPEDILGRVEAVFDLEGRAVKIPRRYKIEGRFRYFLMCAHGFMFAHECKDRLIGGRRSLLLWKASQAYRTGLSTLGLRVPAIMPG
jgi:hypothetical protein